MEKRYKIIPFDINKAKAGAEVVTKKDKLKVEILKYNLNNESPILAVINYNDGAQIVHTYHSNGRLFDNDFHDQDLRIREEIKYRKMTEQELAWWLRDCPEEHREWKYNSDDVDNMIFQIYEYEEIDANKPLNDRILIRSNGGEWREPLIEIND